MYPRRQCAKMMDFQNKLRDSKEYKERMNGPLAKEIQAVRSLGKCDIMVRDGRSVCLLFLSLCVLYLSQLHTVRRLWSWLISSHLNVHAHTCRLHG